MKKAELLAPAGSPEALDAAVGEGADAVYLGLKNFNARMRTSNFAYSQFEGAVRNLHRQNRKIYVTVNTVFEQREADRLYQLLKYLSSVGPDGIIVQDLGTAKMARDNFPGLKLHASTQMNIASARGTNLLSKYGFSRVVLARELTLEEIRDIREKTNMELEVFVHGALCVSSSGLCLFSSYLGGKSANRGMCTQACRRLYNDQENRGYYFSPSDLQLLELIPSLVDAGVTSFKIEGRMKSAEYVGTVVSAYRRVLDGLDGDREAAISEGLKVLQNDFARSKTLFYFNGGSPENWLNASQDGGTGIPLGNILKVKGREARRRGLISWGSWMPGPGDSVRFHRADDTERKSHKITETERDGSGNLWISIPEGFDIGDSVYLIQTKAMGKRYAPVVPRDLSAFRRMPGRDKAPLPVFPPAPKKSSELFPEGMYVGVSTADDLFIVQSQRPIRVMLEYTRRNVSVLLADPKQPVPFSPGEIILVLDPYFPQSMDHVLAEEIPRLLEAGYRQYVVNNLGHFSYFRNTDAKLIAGPYLYVFNRWAQSFISDLGTDAIVSPLENNRQNLEKTILRERRRDVFIPVFAYPALFRIRSSLGNVYDFRNFTDSRNENFTLITGDEGSRIIPEKPFSIVDKIPFLKEAGFSRFIVDFSGPRLRKKDYKDVMDAVKNGTPLPNITRFNWKDGFFSNSESPGENRQSGNNRGG
ncbi:peptidase U32 family protein [Breznakiella homolactica]|uniref:U32 family peptidase n=1 Tax=Breznakiella homolactica TaxID=2798577 RepID=A0A7T7XNE2_9SPIR|nr:peptidase U32 family protein [Breznakiella homolactica]QQO09554.1 U32 family peptidase [Breznakiella homolactica]